MASGTPRRAPAYALEGVDSGTRTAERIAPPVHGFIENTLPSLQAACDPGAAMAGIDLQPTRDGRLALFHDWTLGCRTEGHCVTRTHTLADMQRLDVGHGDTAAGGELVVLGPYGGGGFSSDIDIDIDIDSAALLREVPPGYPGGIWTNRVLDIAPLLRL